MKILTFSLSLLLMLFSCKGISEKKTAEKTLQGPETEFLENLGILCGSSYYGKVLFPENNEPPFDADTIWVTLRKCTDQEVIMPFVLGNDRSRT